ncbi:MAG: hypothetical protein HY873_01755 [Chloroflexi bacterium]|nr:hypothetical protein [Chloroflexota bacterium]
MNEHLGETAREAASHLRQEAEATEARALAFSSVVIFLRELAVKAVPVAGPVADALMSTREKLRADRLEHTIEMLQEELSNLRDRGLANDARVDRDSFRLVLDRWIESAQSARVEDHRRRLARFMRNCIVSGLQPSEADTRRTFLESLDALSEFDLAVLVSCRGSEKDEVRALKPAFPDHSDDALLAAVERLRLHGYIVRSPTGASWNDPLVHPVGLTAEGQQFCEFMLS